MSKAFRCDKCKRFFGGHAEMQMQFSVGVKHSPENSEAQLYLHDLCERCRKEFLLWWCGEDFIKDITSIKEKDKK